MRQAADLAASAVVALPLPHSGNHESAASARIPALELAHLLARGRFLALHGHAAAAVRLLAPALPLGAAARPDLPEPLEQDRLALPPRPHGGRVEMFRIVA